MSKVLDLVYILIINSKDLNLSMSLKPRPYTYLKSRVLYPMTLCLKYKVQNIRFKNKCIVWTLKPKQGVSVKSKCKV